MDRFLPSSFFLHISGRSFLEFAVGISVALTLFSGATEIAIYLFVGLPPVFGPVFFGIAAVIGLTMFLGMAGGITISPAFGLCVVSWLTYVIWATISVNWSTSLVVVGDKEAALILYSTAYYLMGVVAGRKSDVLRAFQITVLLLSVVTLMSMGLAGIRGGGAMSLASKVGALKVFADSYQAITLCLGVAGTFALIKTLQPYRRYFTQAWGLAWAVLSLATMAGGGRGAALGCLLAQAALLILAFLLKREGHNRRLAGVFVVLLPAILGTSFILALQLQLETVERVIRAASSSTDSTGRLGFWKQALAMAEQHPVFGAGLGSYEASANTTEDPGNYPHNLFLETLAETGVIGFVLFCFALIVPIVCVLTRVLRLEFSSVAVWLCLFLITLVEMNVSGTVTDHLLAFCLGLSAGLIARADCVPEAPDFRRTVDIPFGAATHS